MPSLPGQRANNHLKSPVHQPKPVARESERERERKRERKREREISQVITDAAEGKDAKKKANCEDVGGCPHKDVGTRDPTSHTRRPS